MVRLRLHPSFGVCLRDHEQRWVSLEQALAAKAAALSAAEEEIKTSAGSVVALLACSPAVLGAATELAAAASASCVVRTAESHPGTDRTRRG